MIQQVNLYHPMFRKQEKVFSARTLLQSTLIILIGIVLFSVYAKWQVIALESELGNLEQQQTSRLQRIEKVGKQFPVKLKDARLEARVGEMQQESSTKQRLIQVLSTRSFGVTSGFSSHLEGLARQHLDGMWLKSISLTDGGSRLGLVGSTFAPELVPQYLQRLSAEEVFAGVEFRTFNMQRAADKRSIDFTLMAKSEKNTNK
ncbi:MAG: hypothetical protein BMS9Abin26_0390 [Gammaproteobacteria bacterium]|nr:MAG: hypothetical protein BMS9Abin26_0390 [Gammaproteobacteria bacterium]